MQQKRKALCTTCDAQEVRKTKKTERKEKCLQNRHEPTKIQVRWFLPWGQLLDARSYRPWSSGAPPIRKRSAPMEGRSAAKRTLMSPVHGVQRLPQARRFDEAMPGNVQRAPRWAPTNCRSAAGEEEGRPPQTPRPAGQHRQQIRGHYPLKLCFRVAPKESTLLRSSCASL